MLRKSVPIRAPSSARFFSSLTKTTALPQPSSTTLSRPLPQLSNLSKSVASKQYVYSKSLLHTSAVSQGVVKVPQMAESITEGTLKQWVKNVGDYVKVDEEVATIETDKIDVAVNSTEAGKIVEVFAAEEDTVMVGNDLFKIEPGEPPAGQEAPKEQPKEESKDETPSKAAEPEPSKPAQPSPPSPPPSQPQQQQQKPAAPASSTPSAPVSGAGPSRAEHRVKMNRMRMRIAERLKQSQNTAASLTTFNEVDMSSLMEFRKLYKDDVLKEHGVKLGFMSAFAKASCLALKEIPAANASIEGDGLGDTIVYRDYVDLSVAVATEKGLVTPVVRNAEQMNFVEIEKAIADLGKKARDNKLTLEDMAGGSFSISNGGVFGSLYGTPILNLPQAAILGMHSIRQKPVVVDGEIKIRPIMVLALTYDHRLLDGREAVTFLVKVRDYIQDPRRMLLA